MQYDIFYDPLVDAEGLEETSEDDLWFLPGPMEVELDYLPPGPRAELLETAVLDDWRKAEAGNAACLARVAGRIGALDDRLRRGPEGWRHRLALLEAADLSWFVGDRIGPDRLALWISMRLSGVQDDTAALARVAKVLGYRVTVCDAREVFATKRRFPMADAVRVTWPTPIFEELGHNLNPRDAVCILTHDPKFDVPAVQGALATRVGYIGVMGSRKTHSKRMERLADVNVAEADMSRLMSPIGLDLGARTPEETAVSICAEIIARRTGKSVPSLRNSSGPIHS